MAVRVQQDDNGMIEVENLEMVYGRSHRGASPVTALLGVNMKVSRGESCAIIGPSGCGKTTLLYILAGLLKPTGGRVLIGGKPPSRGRRDTALILQDYGLFPWKTVWQNAGLGLELRGVPRAKRDEVVAKVLTDLGIYEFRNHYPSQLSGGQRQRVAIARSLAMDPDIILMDEPFSALDALTREGLQNALLEIWRSRKVTMIMVTHSIEEAAFLGQRVFVMTDRPGRIAREIGVADGAVGPGSPEYRRTPEFHRRCDELRAALEDGASERVNQG